MSNDYVSFLQTEDYPAFCKELFRNSLFYSYNNKKRFLYAKTGVFNIIDIVLNETANIYVKNNRIPDALKITSSAIMMLRIKALEISGCTGVCKLLSIRSPPVRASICPDGP